MAIDKNDGSPAKKRGRPFQPGNRFGRWRPKGSPNKKTLLAQQLFEDHSPAIMARVRIPMMSISHSNLMPIRTERSDAGLSHCEIVIDISQGFGLFSLS